MKIKLKLCIKKEDNKSQFRPLLGKEVYLKEIKQEPNIDHFVEVASTINNFTDLPDLRDVKTELNSREVHIQSDQEIPKFLPKQLQNHLVELK